VIVQLPWIPGIVAADAPTTVLAGHRAGVRRELRAEIAATRFRDARDLDTATHRQQASEQLYALAASQWPKLGFDEEHGGGGDIGGALTSFEVLAVGDLSLMVKAGVQWGLFGGAVQLLGARRHHEHYLRRISDL